MEGIRMVRIAQQREMFKIEPIIHAAPEESNSVERLRQILSTEQGRDVSRAEAASIGESLLDFFEVLAG